MDKESIIQIDEATHSWYGFALHTLVDTCTNDEIMLGDYVHLRSHQRYITSGDCANTPVLWYRLATPGMPKNIFQLVAVNRSTDNDIMMLGSGGTLLYAIESQDAVNFYTHFWLDELGRLRCSSEPHVASPNQDWVIVGNTHMYKTQWTLQTPLQPVCGNTPFLNLARIV